MNTDAKNLLEKVLKDNGYSVTKARLLVCAHLWNKEPHSVNELLHALDGAIDRASMYRTINLFERLGLIQRVYIGWKYKIELSDVFTHHHHHISCLSCGKIKAIHEESEIESLIKKLSSRYDITPERHQLEIQGYCSSCKK